MVDLDFGEKEKIVLFNIDSLRYAFQLSAVERVVPSVEVTPLPQAPDIVLGVVNYQRLIIPVVDIRKRFRLPAREISLVDQFIVAKTPKRLIIIVADSVSGVYELDKYQIVDSAEEFPYTVYLYGIAKMDTNIVLITDIEKFLSLNEEQILDEIV